MNELGVGLGTSGVSAGVVEMVRFGDCGGGVQYLHLVLRRLHRERSARQKECGDGKDRHSGAFRRIWTNPFAVIAFRAVSARPRDSEGLRCPLHLGDSISGDLVGGD